MSNRINCPSSLLLFVFLLLVATQNGRIFQLAEAGKQPIHNADDYDEALDDKEHGDSQQEWGKILEKQQQKESKVDSDFSHNNPSHILAKKMRQTFGTLIGFVKLGFHVPRNKEVVAEIVKKWNKNAERESVSASFVNSVDPSAIIFHVEADQCTVAFRDFILSQPEAYEIKIGEERFRRPGDLPFEQVDEQINPVKYQEIKIKDEL